MHTPKDPCFDQAQQKILSPRIEVELLPLRLFYVRKYSERGVRHCPSEVRRARQDLEVGPYEVLSLFRGGSGAAVKDVPQGLERGVLGSG